MDELEAIRARKLAALERELRAAPAGPVTLTDGNFQEVVTSNRLVLVDFWAAWCGPCRYVAPHVEAVAKDYAGRLTVGKLNVDDNPRTSMRFSVSSIPTLALFRDGKLVDVIIGAVPRTQIAAMVDRWL